MLGKTFSKEIFPSVQSKPPVVHLEALSSCPVICFLERGRVGLSQRLSRSTCPRGLKSKAPASGLLVHFQHFQPRYWCIKQFSQSCTSWIRKFPTSSSFLSPVTILLTVCFLKIVCRQGHAQQWKHRAKSEGKNNRSKLFKVMLMIQTVLHFRYVRIGDYAKNTAFSDAHIMKNL